MDYLTFLDRLGPDHQHLAGPLIEIMGGETIPTPVSKDRYLRSLAIKRAFGHGATVEQVVKRFGVSERRAQELRKEAFTSFRRLRNKK